MGYAINEKGGFRAVYDASQIEAGESYTEEQPKIFISPVEEASVRIGILLDDAARNMGYDSMAVAASYANDPYQQYADDAKKLIAYRSSVWQAAFSVKKPKSADDIMKVVSKVEV